VLVSAAFVPATPLLVPDVAAGAAAELTHLRALSINAIADCLRRGADRVVMVAPGVTTSAHIGAAGFTGIGLFGNTDDIGDRQRGRELTDELPLALSVGQWLVDQVMGRCDDHLTVAHDASTAECIDTGTQLAASARRVAAIVVGDGSACRSDKAPGSLDPRAEAVDTSWMSALTAVDTAGLLALDPALCAQVQVAGRAPWQVAAAMAQHSEASLVGALHHHEDPYGVMYAVATWSRG
jgi:hypothetical protein